MSAVDGSMWEGSRGELSNTRLYLCGGGGFEAVRASRHVWRVGAAAALGPGRGAPRRVAGQRSANYEQHRLANLRKAKARVRRYIKVNGLRFLWSLTFAENCVDVGVADKAFWALSRWLGSRGVPWLAVREFQKRGAVHYHLAVDRFLPHAEVEAAWGQGYVLVSGPKHGWSSASAAAYVTKYIAKDLEDKRLEGFHSYLRSSGLATWESIDTFTRSKEEFLALVTALCELYGWSPGYRWLGDEFQTYGAGPP